jgi:hypothetical protein
MVGISPSYNFKIISLHNIPNDPLETSHTELAVDGRSRNLNRAAWILGPGVGLYRMSTGLIDVIHGVFTFHSGLLSQGAKNLGRGTIESMAVLIPLAIALKSQHAISPLAVSEVTKVALELSVKVCALFVEHYSLMIPTYLALNAACQLPLYLYDDLTLKYCVDIITTFPEQRKIAKLYHDLDLENAHEPMGPVYEYNLGEWIHQCETYGKKV